jgi:hypothetical protein
MKFVTDVSTPLFYKAIILKYKNTYNIEKGNLTR